MKIEKKDYGLEDKTHESMRCGPIARCPTIYELVDKTSYDMRCGVGPCPAIYELFGKAPKEMECGGAFGCPSIKEIPGSYIIIGRKLTQEEVKDFGLVSKINENEAAIEVPKKLIDKKLP